MFSKILKFKQCGAVLAALVVSLFVVQSAHTDILCATHWIGPDGKNVYIYFDYHHYKADGGQGDCLSQIIMNPAPRKKPLDIFVENFYCDSDHLTRVLADAGCQPYIGRILDAFPSLYEHTPPGVRILNIDNRIWKGYVGAINTLGETQVEEKKLIPHLPEIKERLGNDSLVSFLDRTRNDMCNYHIEGVDSVIIPEFDELRNFYRTKIERFDTKKIVDLQGLELQRFAWLVVSEIAIHLLCCSMDANIVNHIVRAQGDVALFAGTDHGIRVEKCLRTMGYVLQAPETVSPERHEYLKFHKLYLGYTRIHGSRYDGRPACKEALSRQISFDQGRELSPAQNNLLDGIMNGKYLAQYVYPHDPSPAELFSWLR